MAAYRASMLALTSLGQLTTQSWLCFPFFSLQQLLHLLILKINSRTLLREKKEKCLCFAQVGTAALTTSHHAFALWPLPMHQWMLRSPLWYPVTPSPCPPGLPPPDPTQGTWPSPKHTWLFTPAASSTAPFPGPLHQQLTTCSASQFCKAVI